MKRLLDYDPVHKISTYFHSDGENFRFVAEQDPQIIQSTLDNNTTQANDDDKSKRGIRNDMWKYATVPAMVQLEWFHKYGIVFGKKEHWPRIYQLLNSREYSKLKTTSMYHTEKEHD